MKPTDLRGILQYIPRFRGKTFVIAVDGAIVTDDNFPNLLVDVAVLRSLSIRVVLVHGASAQIQLLARERGQTASDTEGTGVTDAETLKLALTAANRLTHEILEGLAANDLRAACTNAIVAHPKGIIEGVDHQFTGKVEKVDTKLLENLLEHGIIPVVPPLGFDGEGRTYRVNSDHVAVALAEALGAMKVLFLTTSEGLLCDGKLIRQMLAGELQQLLAEKKPMIAPDQWSKAAFAASACKAGVQRAHIIDGRVDEALLAEVFSNEGVGTLIYANEYQQVRRMMKKDIRVLLRLSKESVESKELMRRTRTTIEKNLADYYVFEIDKNPVACVAMHPYPEQKKGELAYLFVSPSHENMGIGQKMIQYAENKAREAGMEEMIVLSTQAFSYFQSKGGFVEGSIDDLPPGRREKYEASKRNSKVLVKKLVK